MFRILCARHQKRRGWTSRQKFYFSYIDQFCTILNKAMTGRETDGKIFRAIQQTFSSPAKK